jgi:hypothetical protein
MQTYDFDDFITTIKYLDAEDILLTAKKRCVQLEKGWGRPNRKDALILIDKINGLISWIKTAEKPETLQPADFLKFKSIAENLVRKEQMSPEALKGFPVE